MADSYPTFWTYLLWGAAGLVCLAGLVNTFQGSLRERTDGIAASLLVGGAFLLLGFLVQGSRAADNLRNANIEVALAQQALDDFDRTSGLASTSTPMSFQRCQAALTEMTRQMGSPEVIVRSGIVETVRFSGTDGSVVVTCSAPDQKMITTRSPRR